MNGARTWWNPVGAAYPRSSSDGRLGKWEAAASSARLRSADMSSFGGSDDRQAFQCLHCGTHTHGKIAVSTYFTEKDEPGTYHVRYQLVQCSACGDYSLLVADYLGSWYDDTDPYDNGTPVYPAAPKSMDRTVPKSVRDCFLEARVCLKAKAYTASAIMCRKTLEALVVSRDAKKSDLAKSLAELKRKGDIDERLYQWCDALRLAGNKAVHETEEAPSPVDVRDMNDLVEAIIDYIYVFQAKYEAFKKRREEQAEKDTSTPVPTA